MAPVINGKAKCKGCGDRVASTPDLWVLLCPTGGRCPGNADERSKTLQQTRDDVNAARRDLLDAVAESWPGRQLIRFTYWLDRQLRRLA